MSNFETLYEAVKIVRETEKAVMVNVNDFNAHMTNYVVSLWLPKSQIEIIDGKVVKMADWLAKKNGLPTNERMEVIQRKQAAGLSRYDELVGKAKAAGLPVRNRMKTATILEIAKKHGVTL